MGDKERIRVVMRVISDIVKAWETGARDDRQCLEVIAEHCLVGIGERPGTKVEGLDLDIDTLAGVIGAQRRIDDILPVISSRTGLLQELQVTLAALAADKDKSAELMNALLSLQAHSRAIGMTKVGR